MEGAGGEREVRRYSIWEDPLDIDFCHIIEKYLTVSVWRALFNGVFFAANHFDMSELEILSLT